MLEVGIKPENTSLRDMGIMDGKAHWNLPPGQLTEISLRLGQAKMTSSGAIAIDTGEFKGRSPKDKFIVKDSITQDNVWWGNVNLPFDPEKFDQLYIKMIRYFEGKECYVRDCYASADWRYRMDLRVITEYAWSNLFVYNMFLRPSEKELKFFSPEWILLNAPGFKADPETDGTRQHNFSIIDFKRKIILVGGSGYTGEIKKSVFSALNYVLPIQKNVLPMHCSANTGDKNDTAIFFGLSGTGKTTLSADPNRKLIGDDEHGWTPDNIIFNFEGGCYAKTIDLSAEREPDIFNAIKAGALLENIGFRDNSDEINFNDKSKTENTRVSYPLDHIRNIANPSLGQNPKNIFFLTCDALGVLPPISKLTPAQAAFHFISGYTAKVAGTETGITEPTLTFSACFGAPFMPLHPTRYAQMLSDKIQSARANVWLINTGWTGGPYGIGKRISLTHTRALITAALEDRLKHVQFESHEVFGVAVPMSCAGLPAEILDPRKTWSDPEAYDHKAYELASEFLKNFQKFASLATEEILSGAPHVRMAV
jgi:phosphoenolpyruvate carboxykinase (ATP)